jgi:hypothetical protein
MRRLQGLLHIVESPRAARAWYVSELGPGQLALLWTPHASLPVAQSLWQSHGHMNDRRAAQPFALRSHPLQPQTLIESICQIGRPLRFV